MRGGVQLEIGVQVDCQLDAGPTWKYRMKLGWKMLKELGWKPNYVKAEKNGTDGWFGGMEMNWAAGPMPNTSIIGYI